MTYVQEDKIVPPWPALVPRWQCLTPTVIREKYDFKYITVTLKFKPKASPNHNVL